jgi:hypothetical protein
MGLELERGLELFLNLKKVNNHSSSSNVFSVVPLLSMFKKHVLALTQKLLNMSKEQGKYWKMFSDG